MKIKTQEEIEKKHEELNQRMRDYLPNEDDIRKLKDDVNIIRDNKISIDKQMEILLKVMIHPVDTISTDAQRYTLEWVLGHHD